LFVRRVGGTILSGEGCGLSGGGSVMVLAAGEQGGGGCAG